MKRLFVIILVLSMLPLSGCTSRMASSIREPDELDLIQTIGIDKSEKGYSVTISTGMGLNSAEPHIRGGEGPTIDAALDVLKKLSNGHEPFYSHADHVIIGEDMAKSGIKEVLDYIERNSEIRIDTNLFIARGMTAKDLITGIASKETAVADTMEIMDEQIANLGQGYVFTALDVATGLAQNGSALMLALELSEGDNLMDTKQKKLLPNGFGIIQQGKLTDYVSAEQTPSVLILINKLGYLNMQVETKEGTVGFGVSDAKANIEPVFLDDELTKLKIKVEANANVTEIAGMLDLMSDKTRQELGMVVSKKLLANLQSTLKHSKELAVDYMGIGQKAEIKTPMKFQNMSTSWQELFPMIPIEIKVTTTIKRTFDLGQPVNIGRY